VRNYKDANVFLNECNDLKLLGEDDRQDFLEQFQRIVVLDYVIRNTDRGPSNWLVRSEAEFTAKKRPKNVNANQFFDEDIEEENGAQEEGEVRWIGRSINKSIATLNVNNSSDANANNSSSANADADDGQALLSESDEGYRTAVEEETLQNKSQNENNTLNLDLQCAASTGTPKATQIDNSCRSANMVERRVTLAAIDNGLAFPYKHPDDWRGYPFHWAGYPFAKIPFLEDLKVALVPKLADMTFVEELVDDLHGLFSLDRDFTVAKFDQQMGVMRGQILNLTQALKEGKSPAELVQMDCLSVEKKYPTVRKTNSRGGSTEGSIHHLRRSSIRPTLSHHLHPSYSYVNHRKKPKCGCCW